MLYLSEVTGKPYKTMEELEAAETAVAKANEEKELLKAKRKERAEEVEKAFAEVREAQKKANVLLADFCKDYGAFHKTYKEGEKIPSLFDMFFPFF